MSDVTPGAKETWWRLFEESLEGRKGPVAQLERKVLDEVRRRGGARRETKTVVEVHDAEPLKLAGAK